MNGIEQGRILAVAMGAAGEPLPAGVTKTAYVPAGGGPCCPG
jgi:hypothetical protein